MSLRDGQRDVDIDLQVVDWTVRTFTTKEGESREVRSGRSKIQVKVQANIMGEG